MSFVRVWSSVVAGACVVLQSQHHRSRSRQLPSSRSIAPAAAHRTGTGPRSGVCNEPGTLCPRQTEVAAAADRGLDQPARSSRNDSVNVLTKCLRDVDRFRNSRVFRIGRFASPVRLCVICRGLKRRGEPCKGGPKTFSLFLINRRIAKGAKDITRQGEPEENANSRLTAGAVECVTDG